MQYWQKSHQDFAGAPCAKEVIEERGGELREVYVFARFRQCEHEERLLQATPAGLRAQLDCRPMSIKE